MLETLEPSEEGVGVGRWLEPLMAVDGGGRRRESWAISFSQNHGRSFGRARLDQGRQGGPDVSKALNSVSSNDLIFSHIVQGCIVLIRTIDQGFDGIVPFVFFPISSLV